MSWFNGLEATLQSDVPLAQYTWYGLGGPARWLFTPRDEGQLAALVQHATAAEIPWRILGRGANILVRDAGFLGAIIKLSEPAWDQLRFDDSLACAAAGVDFPRLVRQSLDHGLVGLEGLAGIPGTVGGAVRMNAGGRYGSIAQFVRDVRLMEPDGRIVTRSAQEMGFGYRHSGVNGRVVVSATFQLQPGDREAAMARFREIWNDKYTDQPPVSARSAGCIFKNPPGLAAGKLIDEAGLKGTRRGGAEISPRHANFIIAHPGATAQDVLDLIALAQEHVRSRTGIELELEVEVW
jgi:UDP-N-acetylmuramate dehydrogenase